VVQDKRQEEVVGAYAHTFVYHRLIVPEAERARAEAILKRFRNSPSLEGQPP
jgi:hypothetical protein